MLSPYCRVKHDASILPAVKYLLALFASQSSHREPVSSRNPQVCVWWKWWGGTMRSHTLPALRGNLWMGHGSGWRLKTTFNLTGELLDLVG